MKMENRDKYSIEGLQQYPEHTWSALVGIMIANELAAMNNILTNEKNKSALQP